MFFLTYHFIIAMSKIDFVLDLGGSIVNPGRISKTFLQGFQKLIIDYIKGGKRFCIVVGGGFLTRVYQNFLRNNFTVDNDDLDTIGIRPTRLNAELVRIILKLYAYPVVLESPEAELEDAGQFGVFVFSGWKPGWSTDYVAVRIAKRFGIRQVISLSNIGGVYRAENGKLKKDKVLSRLRWQDYERLIGSQWVPGMKVPFDPVATAQAKREGMEVAVMSGKNLKNIRNFLEGKPFAGTLIS